MKCSNCGNTVNEGDLFCSKCSAKLIWKDNQSSEQDDSPSGFSIAALITGIASVPIVPIVLGGIDIKKINNGLAGRKGLGFDIAGIILGSLTTIAFTITIIAVSV